MAGGGCSAFRAPKPDVSSPAPTRMCLPCGGPRNGPPSVHQHTPAVTGGRVALNWLVEAAMCTLRDHYIVVLGLLGFLESRLMLLVTGGGCREEEEADGEQA